MKKSKYILFLALLMPLLLPLPAQAQSKNSASVEIGKVIVSLIGPEGLSRVDGGNAKADAYIKTLEPKFKLRVLGLYADPGQWKAFVDDASAGRPAAIPRFAMICVPAKMPRKSYDPAKMRKEFKKYDNWFSLAANNRVTAALLTSQGNKKLKEYMGVDIDFKFRSGDYSKKFSESSNSISVGALVSFNVHKKASDVYLTVTSLGIGDKLVFLAYFENSGPPEKLAQIQAASLMWRQRVSELNAGQYRNK